MALQDHTISEKCIKTTSAPPMCAILPNVFCPNQPIILSSRLSIQVLRELHAQERVMNFYFRGAYYSFTQTQVAIAALVVVLAIIIAIAAFQQRGTTRTTSFRTRFGTEYDRALLAHGSKQEAEDMLAGRESRVQSLEIRDLNSDERNHFNEDWKVIQARFVDHPRFAVTEADDLINALLESRGYPHANFEQRAADISVTHPHIMEDYRLAHSVAVRLGNAEATTEELRTAIIQYRSVFDELVQATRPAPQLTTA